MRNLVIGLMTLFTAAAAVAEQYRDNNNALVTTASIVQCGTGLTCTRSAGSTVKIITTGAQAPSSLVVSGTSTLTGGMVVSGGQQTRYASWKSPTLTSGTSVTPSATTVYLSQVYIHANASITGIAINNAATVGTNNYIVALFTSSGAVAATSALGGVLTAGANAWQQVPFTAPYSAVGPGVYWIGLYVSGATDRFFAIPAVGAYAGLAGTVTGQVFGTVAALALPTTFTADVGPVAYTY